MKHVVLSVLFLAALASGQWSEPVDVGVDTSLRYAEDFQFALAGGDTLWAFYRVGHRWPDTSYAFAHWSLGDSWSDAQILAADTFTECLAAGVDAQRRVWLSWYNGTYYTYGDTWGICTRVHDSLGWGPQRLAFPEITAGQCFASDKHGNWYMGICESHAPLPDLYTSAVYSSFLGDTWTWPRTIAQGYGSPLYVDYGLPLLVARPDTGLWAVYSHTTFGLSEILIDHVLPDTVFRLARLDDGGWYYDATADSVGRLWVIYIAGESTLVSATFEGGTLVDRRVISDDCRYQAQICTDPSGWIWAYWTQNGRIPVVSYNSGRGWSRPEPVTDSSAGAVDITSDRNGRVYVAFCTRYTHNYTTYRIERPGLAQAQSVHPLANRAGPTILSRLPASFSAFDAMGRRVVSPKPGVYFLRDEGRVTGDVGRTRKVIIQR